MRVQGPRFNEIEQILLVESHKLDPSPLDEGPRPKSGKLRLKPTWHNLEEKSIGSYPKKKGALRRRVHDTF
jgi:hypothetical protein